MHEAHDYPYSGHFGSARTSKNLSRFYWWPKMDDGIREYVRCCDVCQRNKANNQKEAGKLQPLLTPERRWETVSMDLITQLRLTAAGNDAIVVFVDKLSKMTHFVACKTAATAEDLARIFLRTIFAVHGLPKNIISDRDTRFTSDFWKTFFGVVGTKLCMSTAFHPQSDGQTERMNRTLQEVIRHYVGPRRDDWDTLLPLAEFAINNSVAESTGMTPFYMNSGQHPNTPLSIVLLMLPMAHNTLSQLQDHLSY